MSAATERGKSEGELGSFSFSLFVCACICVYGSKDLRVCD